MIRTAGTGGWGTAVVIMAVYDNFFGGKVICLFNSTSSYCNAYVSVELHLMIKSEKKKKRNSNDQGPPLSNWWWWLEHYKASYDSVD